MRSENLYWLWLSECLGVGSRHMLPLIEKFESPFEIYRLPEDEIALSGCVPDDVAHRLADKKLDRAYEIMDYCVVNNIGILSFFNDFYPSSLRSLQDPPAVLYYKGSLPELDQKLCVAVVGTRKMSEYGKRTAYKIAYELGSAGVVVVSGMALGIDSVAACGAISAGGKTIAVLGCGIDVVYPRQHAKLQRIIENNGVVLTEFAPGTQPSGINFPIRNRIISGLAQGTLVVEADDKSGAIITAKKALIQGRDVFAVPGNIDESNSQGTNMLITDGANIVLSARDIIDNYELNYGKFINYTGLAFAEEIYEFSENELERMGVAARAYNNTIKDKRAPELKTSEYRPTRRPPEVKKKSDAPSTYSADGLGLDPKLSPKAPAQKRDGSKELVEKLDERTRKIFEEIPIDRAISIEKLCALGYTVGDVMSSLTVLEINGLISTLPGNLYIRR